MLQRVIYSLFIFIENILVLSFFIVITQLLDGRVAKQM